MKKLAGNQRLLRRNGVYYYRRRVPPHLVKGIGKQFVQHSLKTTSLANAKKLRTLKDLEWDARFDGLQKDVNRGPDSANSQPAVNSTQLSEGELLRLVREYVERKDKEFRKRFAGDPPQSEREKAEMRMEAGLGAQTLRDRDDPKPTSGFTIRARKSCKRLANPSTILTCPTRPSLNGFVAACWSSTAAA